MKYMGMLCKRCYILRRKCSNESNYCDMNLKCITATLFLHVASGGREKHKLNTNFVIEAGVLEDVKGQQPYLAYHQDDLSHDTFVADVVSIGSITRPEYLEAQVETWAKHVAIRDFWGFTELQDFVADCDSVSVEALQNTKAECKDMNDWDPHFKTFIAEYYGITENGFKRSYQGGWICAQRRPGRALGWIHTHYIGRNETQLPDLLLIVDDGK